ncbi:SufB/SufD family protein [Tannockella kyphosi]|uniref:SufB/SufD family protein n=1 Tax=Tannockella kyphosi TaxID=2899121 RepID=UPI002012418B|nr:SufD family Fe-S cluster assembly protein [Tannockella kyphosi]
MKIQGLDNKITIQEENQIIHIDKDCSIHIEYAMDATVCIEISANVELVETYVGTQNLTIQKTITVNQNCVLKRFVSNEMNQATLLLDEKVVCKRDSHVRCAYVDLASINETVKYTYQLVEPNAQVEVRYAGMAHLENKKAVDMTMHHLAPFTSATMDNYGVVREAGTLVIDGTGRIDRGMMQSSSHQVNKILVFDKTSKAQANPYLFIDEYDVKASHGASVGKIDEEHLYYLQSRGLNRYEAMHLVVYGYFIPVMEYIENESLKEEFSSSLMEKVGV